MPKKCQTSRPMTVYLLVLLDKEYSGEHQSEPWEEYYARRIREHFTR